MTLVQSLAFAKVIYYCKLYYITVGLPVPYIHLKGIILIIDLEHLRRVRSVLLEKGRNVSCGIEGDETSQIGSEIL